MGRRKKFTPEPFENAGNSKLSAAIYASMLQSPAWSRLSKSAMVLYMYCKLQYYGQSAKPVEGNSLSFVFNRAMYVKTYGLYTNGAQFSRDMKQLEEQGFIKVLERGKCTRTKNIYQFSSEWQTR